MANETLELKQTTQFVLKELSLVAGSNKFDLRSSFQEFNIFENLFTPCTSANIVIQDSQNLFKTLKLNGDEKIIVNIKKDEDSIGAFNYEKTFAIYMIGPRSNVNQTSQVYKIGLVNEDFIYSLQNKVSQKYEGNYFDFVRKILKDYLKVSDNRIDVIEPTSGVKEIIVPNLAPFDAINFITKRSTSDNNIPDYLFYESKNRYNFTNLTTIWEKPSVFKLNMKPKNLSNSTNSEFLGVRDMKVISSFDKAQSIKDGVYAGRFIGFDTVTRSQRILDIKKTEGRGNDDDTIVDFKNVDKKSAFEMVNSRIVSYPFTYTRQSLQYIKENDPDLSTKIDNTHDYIFQRKAIFTNLMQKRLMLTLNGNFALTVGSTVDVYVPIFAAASSNKSVDELYDQSLTAKYIVTAVRHVIKYQKHETIIEVATDSSTEQL
jgi:hypothetical protein